MRSATECVEPSNTAGGTTAAAAANATMARGAVMIAWVTLPATDIELEVTNHIQKNRAAASTPVSRCGADVRIYPLRLRRTKWVGRLAMPVHLSVSADPRCPVHRFPETHQQPRHRNYYRHDHVSIPCPISAHREASTQTPPRRRA